MCRLLTVKLRFLEDLDLADVDIVEWVKVRAGLLNVLGDAVGDAENKQTKNNISYLSPGQARQFPEKILFG